MIFSRMKRLQDENNRLRHQLRKALHRANTAVLEYQGLANECKNYLDPCRICDHKACADCRNNHLFKWRGEINDDDLRSNP